MITIADFPPSNFTVNDIVEKGHDRRDIVSLLQRMERDGKGTFTIGRRGSKSRWTWNQQQELKEVASVPATTFQQSEEQAARNERQALALLVGFKGAPTPVALFEHIDGLMKELTELRKSAVVIEPPGIKHVPISWLIKSEATNGRSFWDWSQREEIARELLAYRGITESK